MYVSGQMVPGLGVTDLKLLDDWIKQGHKLMDSVGGVMLVVAAVGLAVLVVVRVVVNRTRTAPLGWAVSPAKRVAMGDLRGTTEAQQPLEQTLSFTAAGMEFGVPILKVREVLPYESVTEVPGAPGSVRGVASVRGTVVPVLDLGAKLGRGVAAATKRSCILVVEARPAGVPVTLSVFADAVNEVVEVRAKDVESPSVFEGGAKPPCLVGLVKLEKGPVLLIDIHRLLTAYEAEVVGAALAPVAAKQAAAPAPTGG